MDTLRLLATLIPLSVSSGINLYATVLVAGLCIRFGWVQDVPPSLQVLGSWPVIIAAAFFFVVETLADKIPFVDNLWDLIHTPIRPLGAALIALTALGHLDPAAGVIGTLAAGGIALVSHGGKAGTRVALNVASPTENITNIVLSVIEDLVAGGLTFIALKYPFEASAVAIVILLLILLIVPQLLRWAWFSVTTLLALLQAVVTRVRGKTAQPDFLPAAHNELLEHRTPLAVAKSRPQGIKGVRGRVGYVSVFEDKIAFTYNTLRGPRVWTMDRGLIKAAYLDHRAWVDVLQIYCKGEKQREKIIRFMFQKNRTALAQQVAIRLGARAKVPLEGRTRQAARVS